MFLSFILKFLFLSSCTHAVFLMKPGPGPVLAPVGVGARAQLNCSTVSARYVPQWILQFPNMPMSLETGRFWDDLLVMDLGVTVQTQNSTAISVLIDAKQENNNTFISCVAIDEISLERNISTQAQLILYGK